MNNDRLEQLYQYLEQQPNDAFLNHAIGLEYLKKEDFLSAIKYFNHVLVHDPLYVGTYYQLAKAYELTDDLTQAKLTYERGMEAAKKMNDRHAYSELQMALEMLD